LALKNSPTHHLDQVSRYEYSSYVCLYISVYHEMYVRYECMYVCMYVRHIYLCIVYVCMHYVCASVCLYVWYNIIIKSVITDKIIITESVSSTESVMIVMIISCNTCVAAMGLCHILSSKATVTMPLLLLQRQFKV
jgi:hypothetical protein